MSFGTRTLVSSNYVNGRLVTNISNPSLSLREVTDGDLRPVIAWQATDLVFQSYRPIFVRHPSGNDGNGNPIFVTTVFDWGTSNAHGKTPTAVCYWTPIGLGYQNPDVSAVWQDDPSDPNGNYNNIVAVNKINGTWGSQVSLQNPAQFSSVAQGEIYQTTNGGALVAWTGTSGTPYPVTASRRTNNSLPKITLGSSYYARGININLESFQIPGLSGVFSLVIREGDGALFNQNTSSSQFLDNYFSLAGLSSQQTSVDYTLALFQMISPPNLTGAQSGQTVFVIQSSKSLKVLARVTLNDLLALWAKRTAIADTLQVARTAGSFTISENETIETKFSQILSTNINALSVFEFVGAQDSLSLFKNAGLTSSKPDRYSLVQNFPNPFNPSTTINYQLPTDGEVTLRIYDVLGQEVRTLVNHEIQEAGYKSVHFDASGLTSGIYFYELQAGKFLDVKKMLLMK